MRKYLLVLLLLMCGSVFAQTGVYMDEERRGEGVTVFQYADLHGVDQVTFYFYTYDDQNRQRWFLGSDEWDGLNSTGTLYATDGVNYPEGIPSNDPFEEDVVIVGKPFAVGTYVFRAAEKGGYLLWVSELEEVETLDVKLDYLYDRTFFMTYPLILAK